MNTRTITTVAAFAAACLAGSTAYAGPSKPAKPIVKVAEESCITGDIGADVVSNYVTKGIVQNNQGFIIQPYADLHFRIYKGAGALTSVTVDVGVWNSFNSHRGRVPAGQTTSNWYEFDFKTGLTLNFGKLSLSPYFMTYESPASYFPNAYTSGITVAYDDTDLLGGWALHPYATVELELQGTTGNAAPRGASQYYELGVAPGHTWHDLTLSLPLKAGFGSSGFYVGNKSFGFASAGVRADYALSCIPACLGKWTLSSSFTYYRLGTGAAAVGDFTNAPAATGRPVDKNQMVFQGGLKVAF
jgi:hypothetical protein